MSPQTRRGRATPASHRKSPAKSPVEAGPPPEREIEPAAEDSVAARHHTATPGVKRRGAAPVRRNSMLYNLYGYFKAYIPLLAGFLLLFAGVWVYTSFGPHTPSPSERWTTIETQWKPKVDADRQKVSAAVNDFAAQQTAYKAFRDDLKGWMDALNGVAATDWTDAKASAALNTQIGTDMPQFITFGTDEVGILDQVVAATSANDVIAMGQTLSDADVSFWQYYGQVKSELFSGSALPSTFPTLALPSGSLSPSASPGASGSPAASTAAAPTPTPIPPASPSAS